MTRLRRDERGSALVFAIGVMLMVGLISTALLSFIRTSVVARPNLDTIRNREYAADAAIETAVATLRSQSNLRITPCATALALTPANPSLNDVQIHVDCADADQAVAVGSNLVVQRNVVFTTCAGSAACTDPATIVIRARVNFELAPNSDGPATRTYVQSWSVNR